MNLSSIRASAIALVSAVSLAACDSGALLLWPWVEIADSGDDPNAPPPPPPPLTAVDPLDPDAPQNNGAVPNPNANTGAPQDGTPFPEEKPENPAIDTGDSKPPVSAETGEELPPLPVPTEEASTPTTPPEPPVSGPAPEPEAPAPAPKPSFYYFRAGNLAPSSGSGSVEQAVLVPDMAFPIKDAPAIAQSQV